MMAWIWGDLALQNFEEFKLTEKVAEITADNALNNTTMAPYVVEKVQFVY